MNLTLYKTSNQDNVVNKVLENIKTVSSITAYDKIDIINPTFILSYDASLLTCNYLYCNELARYYYTKPSLDTGGRLVLTCSVDPLMSFKDDIYNAEATILRSESIGRPTMIPDSQLPIIPNQSDIITQIGFNSISELTGSSLTNQDYILITLGG